MILNPRQMDDGTLIFPKRGGIPPPLREGYVRDQADPWVQKPILPDCVLRSQIESKVPCNRSPTGWRTVIQLSCAAGKHADYNTCVECVGFDEQPRLIQIHYKPKQASV